jgi:hypothetical protein
MRVGFVTRLLWDRYGPFWLRLLEAAGAEVALPDAERVAGALADPRVEAVSGAAFRRAAAEAIALSACERIVVPDLNAGYAGSRGSAQDPFVADFPAALARAVPGLPPLAAVPAELDAPGLEGAAVGLLSVVSPSPGGVRRVWQTHRADARPPRPGGAPTARLTSPATTVALVGQPWHLTEALRAGLEGPGEHLLSAHQLAPADLREEGLRADPGLAPTDAEALGAVRRFARRGDVATVRMVVDPTSGADAWLERRARALTRRRPFETVRLPDGDAEGSADEERAADAPPAAGEVRRD